MSATSTFSQWRAIMPPRFMLLVLVLAMFVSVHDVAADDWTQWQGPNRDAVSQEKGLLQEWPESGPPLAWRVEGLGGGDSAPAVVDGKLFGMSNRDGKEVVWALSEADGDELWETSLGEAVEQRMSQSQEGPSCTPTVDGDRLYVIGMGGRLACLSTQDGEILWQRSLTEEFGGLVPPWSYRESPLIDGDRFICTPGGPDAMMVALDKRSGETLWQSKPPSEAESSLQPERDRPVRSAPSERPQRTGRRGGNQRVASPAIAGAQDSRLYASEHWGMTAFSHKVPNGKYLAKLHFAETYQGVTAAGGRVFSFNVHGKEFKDFDVWEKAGGPRRAYVESVPVEVTDGEFRITFAAQVENPAIKAMELIPQPPSPGNAETLRVNAGASTKWTDSSGNEWLPGQGFDGGSANAGEAGGSSRPPAGRQRRGRRGMFGGGPRSGAAYSSAIAIDLDGGRQYVQMTANALVGVSAESGEVLWQYSRPANPMGIHCTTPLYQEGLVFASSAYGAGAGAVRLSKGPDGGIEEEEVYSTNRMQNHHGGVVVVDGALYGANGGNGGGMLACLDFQTGEVLWRNRNAPKGALAFADGRLYLRGEEGPLLLIEPSQDKFIERGRFEQPDRSSSPAWAHPIIANGKLYIRDQNLLLCYDVQAK